MYEKIISLLTYQGVKFDVGLSKSEIDKIEKIYEFHFPLSLRCFLEECLPISKGFYNWRNFKTDNIERIKEKIKKPVNDILELADEVPWCDKWGKEPEDRTVFFQIVKKMIKEAPVVIPIYAHRYMPEIMNGDVPIISIHGVDIIYYGCNLEEYFLIEFGELKQENLNYSGITKIPFWSDIM